MKLRNSTKHTVFQTHRISSFSFLTRQRRYQSLLMYLWLPNTLILKHSRSLILRKDHDELLINLNLQIRRNKLVFKEKESEKSTYSGASESHSAIYMNGCRTKNRAAGPVCTFPCAQWICYESGTLGRPKQTPGRELGSDHTRSSRSNSCVWIRPSVGRWRCFLSGECVSQRLCPHWQTQLSALAPQILHNLCLKSHYAITIEQKVIQN